jgi:hypothetical protein
MNATAKLVSISSESLSIAELPSPPPELWRGPLGTDLLELLRLRNGFYAFEGALHVLPWGQPSGVMNLEAWNSRDLWTHEYGGLAEGLFFFAEDAFGNQFCLREGGVCSFDAETGETESLGRSVEDWAHRVLSEYELLTGFPLFHDWQVEHGRVPSGSRLVPIVPFVLGGEYSLPNLRVAGAVSAMRSCGNLARQILDLPDGTRVEFKLVE